MLTSQASCCLRVSNSWTSDGTPAPDGFVNAPVNLPYGATITSLELAALDNDGSPVAPLVNLSGMRNTVSGTQVSVVLNATAALTTESPKLANRISSR